MNHLRQVLRWTLVVLGSGYALICAGMFVWQRQLLYHPDPRDVTLDVGLVPGAEVQALQTQDGERLLTWWVPPASNSAAVYLYLHGNARTLENRAERLAFLVEEGAGLLAVSWRGYGGSSGAPTEDGLRFDARAAYDWVNQRVGAERIIVFGESLGTGPAVELAATVPTAALVLDSAYGSIAAVAIKQYPWLPVDLLLRDRFDSLEFAPRIRVPVRSLHCRDDRLVPLAEGEALLAAMGSQDKSMTVVPRRCHVPSVLPLASQLRELEQQVASSI